MPRLLLPLPPPSSGLRAPAWLLRKRSPTIALRGIIGDAASHQYRGFHSALKASALPTTTTRSAVAVTCENALAYRPRRSLIDLNTSTSTCLASTQSSPGMYTAAFAFFEAIWDAGITHCFVNLGSDHPSLVEAMVKGAKERPGRFPKIITCPHEMVAMSMADGYARQTGKIQCVLVHVDVGTQNLGAAVHNASSGRAPVLVFAGVSGATQEGEMAGSRTEWSNWWQDIHDQTQIVSQFCRYSTELRTGKNIKQMVNRAIQYARSEPRGPVYVCAAREILGEEIEPVKIKQEDWEPVTLGALPTKDVKRIADALAGAKSPLIVTGYAGRNHAAVPALVELANTVKGLRVLDANGGEMAFPADHPAWLGMKFNVHPEIEKADVILVVDCDMPWVPINCKPREDAKIFHIDCDPLKDQMVLYYIAAQARYRADSALALEQLANHLKSDEAAQTALASAEATKRWEDLQASHKQLMSEIDASIKVADDGSFDAGYLAHRLRELCPQDTVWAIEAVTSTQSIHRVLRLTEPGQWINSGAGGLGWSGGAALGIKLGTDAESGGPGKGRFVCHIVGDGTFLYSVPGSVYWIAAKYKIPILTIVLNNKGWRAPRNSLQLVYPTGLGSKVSDDEINITIDSPTPDYSGLAKAAAGGELFAARVDKAADLDKVLNEAIAAVQGGQAAVVDCKI